MWVPTPKEVDLGSGLSKKAKRVSDLVKVTVVGMKHHDQSKLGRKWFISLTVPSNSSLSKAVRTKTRTGQKPRGGS